MRTVLICISFLAMTGCNLVRSDSLENSQNKSFLSRSASGARNEFGVTKDTPGYEKFVTLKQGCSKKDCIPAIDEPTFESAASADQWLEDEAVVFALDFNGVERTYPQAILNWHEIVNDELAGDPIAITFCPLCGSAIAFDRRVSNDSGELILDFGVSGKLHQSDLVMYDRQTLSLWQQITGEAIVGELFGTELTMIPMETVRWRDWKKAHPETEVLTRESGGYSNAQYAQYPYGDYEESARVNPGFFDGEVDDTLFPKEEVFGIVVNGQAKAYPRESLTQGSFNDSLAGVNLSITVDGGKVSFIRQDTGERVPASRLFWFSWKEFYPDTEIYK